MPLVVEFNLNNKFPDGAHFFLSFFADMKKVSHFHLIWLQKKEFLPSLDCSSRIGKHLVEQLKMNHLSKHIWKLCCEANLNFLLHHHQHTRSFSALLINLLVKTFSALASLHSITISTVLIMAESAMNQFLVICVKRSSPFKALKWSIF